MITFRCILRHSFLVHSPHAHLSFKTWFCLFFTNYFISCIWGGRVLGWEFPHDTDQLGRRTSKKGHNSSTHVHDGDRHLKLISLLTFLKRSTQKDSFNCLQNVLKCVNRASKCMHTITIWRCSISRILKNRVKSLPHTKEPEMKRALTRHPASIATVLNWAYARDLAGEKPSAVGWGVGYWAH